MPNLVEIGSVVPEKKIKRSKVYNRQMMYDNGQKQIAICHLSDSGDLIKYSRNLCVFINF